MRLTVREIREAKAGADGPQPVEGHPPILVLDVAGIDGPVAVPLPALADRMAVYGLDSEEEALNAILREHAVRLGHAEPHSEDRRGRMGGLHPNVTVAHSADAKGQRDKLLRKHTRALSGARLSLGLGVRSIQDTLIP